MPAAFLTLRLARPRCLSFARAQSYGKTLRGAIYGRTEKNTMPKTAPKKAPMGAVLQMAAVLALKQPERVLRFAEESKTAQRAFSAMGKLFRVIEANLKKTESIYTVLKKAGVKKGTISNASYASKVYDLVEKGILTEAEFDTFTFNDCWQIVRVQSGSAKRQLKSDELAVAIRSNPDFAEDLSALFEHGCTAEEKAAKDKAAEAARKAAEKAAAEQADKERKELEKLRKENKALQQESPAPGGKTETGPVEDDGEHESAPTASHTPRAKEGSLTATDVCAMIEEVELAITELNADDQKVVVARILELADTVRPKPAKPAKGPGTKTHAARKNPAPKEARKKGAKASA